MILQSGVIPYRVKNDQIEVLLVRSSGGKHWIIPKGWINPLMTAADSAAKEAWEEAGVRGTLWERSIGTYKTLKWGYPCQVEVFPMRVDTESPDYPEAKRRKRLWMHLPDAIKQVRGRDLKSLIKHLGTRI